MKFPDVWILKNGVMFRVKTIRVDITRRWKDYFEENSPWIVEVELTIKGSDKTVSESIDYVLLKIGPYNRVISEEILKVCKKIRTEIFNRFLRYISHNYKDGDIVDIDDVMNKVVSPEFVRSAINLFRKQVDSEINVTSPFLK